MLRFVAALVLMLPLSSCLAVAATGAVVGAAGAVVSTGAVVGAAIPGDDDDKDDD